MSVSTDTQGRFVFRPVDANNEYNITATKLGYIAGGLMRSSSLGDRGMPVNFAQSNWISDLEIALQRWAVISGRVTDEAGEAIVGIPVRALSQVWVAGRQQFVAGPITTTDDRGVYRISKLQPGGYIVTVPSVQASVPFAIAVPGSEIRNTAVLAAGREATPTTGPALDVAGQRVMLGNYAVSSVEGPSHAYPTLFYPGSRSLKVAKVLRADSGKTLTEINVTLHPVPVATVSGMVHGPPSERAGLVLRLLVAGGENLGMGGEQATTVVAEDGTFLFANVPSGSYVIQARRTVAELILGTPAALGLPQTPGWIAGPATVLPVTAAPGGTQVSIRASDVGDNWDGETTIEVGNEHLRGVVIRLQRTVTLAGAVLYDDEGTEPAPPLVAEPVDGSARFATVPARLGADRRSQSFVLHGLRRTKYFLRLPPNSGWVIKTLTAAGHPALDAPIDMTEGDRDDISVVLSRSGATLSGNVIDVRGAHVQNAAVFVFPTEESLRVNFGFTPPRIRVVPYIRNREFSCRDLPAGDYYVVAVGGDLSDMGYNPIFLKRVESHATRLSLTLGQKRSVTLPLTVAQRQ